AQFLSVCWRSGDRLDLNSFPTRRSSDLGFGRDCGLQRGGDGGTGGGGRGRPPRTGRGDRGRRRFERFHGRAGGGSRSPGSAPAGDRKSTRLNSSHVKNSYAVFCLKKKTN